MPVVTPSTAILIGLVVAPGIFALCAFFTRAGWRRIAGALVGAAAYALLQYAWDRFAAVQGWWSYPAYQTSTILPLPIPIYLFAGFVFAGFGLIGWRFIRRFGTAGLIVFLAGWVSWGFFHDAAGSRLFSSSQLMVLENRPAAWVADILVYTTCMAAVLLSIRVIGGPFTADELRDNPKETST